MAAGIAVPALAAVNIPGWFTVAQSCLNYSTTSWSEPWSKTIDYVANLCGLQMNLGEDTVELTKGNIPTAMNHPPDGSTGDVCTNHDDDPTRAEANPFDILRNFGDAVVLNRVKGEVMFKTDSNETTRQFYRFLKTTHGIRKLVIDLAPDTAKNDFNALTENLTAPNVDNMSLFATRVVFRKSCYSEVLKLMLNPRCRSLCLRGFGNI
ncbi:hypothetical protein EC968_008491 [Mortierella alpina]|nr:hypothetical protein EC968_008491 [Mortierella alpina]